MNDIIDDTEQIILMYRGDKIDKKVKQRIMIIAVFIIVILTVRAIGFHIYNMPENRLARVLNLGQKYLLEEDYEQAVVEFNKAIEIDPMSVDAYLGAAEAYIRLGDRESAKETVECGLEAATDSRLEDKLKEIQSEIDRIKKEEEERQRASEATKRETEEIFYPMMKDVTVPFTVDDIILGETSIETAKSAYANRPYAKSNFMNNNTEDTVYTCFGLDMPVPDGYEEYEFGFIFSEPVNGGGILYICIRDPDFTCIGGLHVGDMGDVALEYFELQEIVFCEDTDWEWILDNGAVISYHKENERDYYIDYELANNRVRIEVVNSIIHCIDLQRIMN